jgi:hypothetical protein
MKHFDHIIPIFIFTPEQIKKNKYLSNNSLQFLCESLEELRDHILDERSWEFFTEELRRQDLIRHGKFIELANERGKSAFDYHVLFPIPQNEIDRNPNLEQNPGY